MGVDLALGIIKYESDWWLCTNRIDFDRNYGLFEQIDGFDTRTKGKIVPCKIPDETKVDWYNDEGIERITEDAYGSPLTYTTAGELAKLKPGNTGEWNLAMLAMLKVLPSDTKIVLYWH